MGKIRVKSFGDEEQEKNQKQKSKQRAQAKKTEQKASASEATFDVAEAKKTVQEKGATETPKEEPAKAQPTQEKEIKAESKTEEKPEEKVEKKSKKAKFAKKKQRSNTYLTAAKLVDKNKKYPLKEALSILPKLKRAKFDETVELHINTLSTGISGNLSLPHGTGKSIKVEIVNLSEDPKHVEEIVKKVESGKIDFDVLIATPDSMPKLAKIARYLGPRGLMPNPKNGTVTPKPKEIAKKFEGGQINFKTEAKFPVLHMTVGKVSFGDKKLEDNIQAAISAVKTQNIKNLTLKSTMSPGIKIDSASLG